MIIKGKMNHFQNQKQPNFPIPEFSKSTKEFFQKWKKRKRYFLCLVR